MRGRVQGVGFRPTVWRMARELDLNGEVLNDAEGVLMRVGGEAAGVNDLLARHRRASRRRWRASTRSRPARYHGALAGRIPHRRECGRRGADRGRARRRHLRGLRRRDARSGRAPLPLSVHQLHPLRAAAQHRHRHPLRPRARRRWRHSRCARACAQPNIEIRPIAAFTPRRSPAMPAARGRALIRFDGRAVSFDQHSTLDDVDAARRAAAERRDRRRQGTRRLSPRLRRDQRRGGGAAAPVEAPRAEAVRADGARPRDHPPLLRDRQRRRAARLAAPRRRSYSCAPSGPRALAGDSRRASTTLGFMLPTTPLHAAAAAGGSIARW